jgi:hypothetical protein
MRFSIFLLIGILGLASIETAAARSCSEQGTECIGWVKANVPDAARQSSEIAICRAEVPRCKARCKAGENTSSEPRVLTDIQLIPAIRSNSEASASWPN